MIASLRTIDARITARNRFMAGTADREAAARYRELACKSTDPERIADMLHRAEESERSANRNFTGNQGSTQQL